MITAHVRRRLPFRNAIKTKCAKCFHHRIPSVQIH
uniref:Uncharacterized protein n=1 Tax=Arundo donax TaxID=35708 RepID=A0A0A8ZGS3_ARUDO